jgi:hypothetical protein
MQDLFKIIDSLSSKITLFCMVVWGLSYLLNPSPEKIGRAGEIIVQAAIPWWVPIIQFNPILAIVLIYFLAKRRR